MKRELKSYRFHLLPREPLQMPAVNKGSTIRGGFGAAFRRLVCIDLRLECAACDLRYTCPYTRVFNPFVPPEAERLSKNQNIPRPFVVKPPLETKTRYLPGESLVFDFVVVGEAINYLPYFVVAFRELGESGFGLNRARCTLSSIEALGLHGEVSAVYDGTEGVVRPPQQNLSWQEITARAASFGGPREITIRFLTPTTLKAEGEVVTVPQFHHLIKRLRDRVNALASFYCGEPLSTKFAYDVLQAAYALPKADDKWQAELRRLIQRHRNAKHPQAPQPDEWAERLKTWATHLPDQCEELGRWLVFARFVAQVGEE